MLWVLLDVLIGVVSLVVLGLAGWALYRRLRALTRGVSAASESVSAYSSGLQVRQSPGVHPREVG